ncbi:MAG: class I SAM-dependent DNA methyltransferase [Burkholderiaceae bacterium]
MRDLKSRGSQQQLLADFEDYLNGFSPNVQDIIENFKFRNQLQTLSKADAIGTLINKFLDPEIDLSPAGVDNHSMGTVFEELVRKFNEDNNEEAGEHWTPRDAVRLMANLVFLPIEGQIKSGTYLLYDCACGTGGMLTVAEETLTAIAAKRNQQVRSLLYGQEINPETYAVCKADMLLKGEGESADHIVGGAEWSTLSHDAFPAQEFDFMLANPPYGKSWKKDLEAMGGKDGMRDPRFKVMHKGEELSLVTRSSDGQMLFLANMASKMNGKSALGSRIAEVHNGSSLFTGDAGQGESNIRRWLIENDWLEAIVALPLNLFYNTGIATYIWVLSNRKPVHRRGQVQLIDASQWFKPLRKNLGKKNCELAPEDIGRISRTFLELRKRPSRRSSPTPPSATGRSRSSARCGCTASLLTGRSRRCASTPATRTCAPRSTRSSAMTSSGISPKSPSRWRSDLPTGAATATTKAKAKTTRAAPRRACPRKRRGSCSTPRPGSATDA